MTYRINGRLVSRKRFLQGARANGMPQTSITTYRGHDPLISEGIGCLQSQVPEMRETIHKHGIQGVTVKDSGQLEITSKRGRKKLMRVRGMKDNEGGYGDG